MSSAYNFESNPHQMVQRHLHHLKAAMSTHSNNMTLDWHNKFQEGVKYELVGVPSCVKTHGS